MPEVALHPHWKAATCTKCKNFRRPDYCDAWKRRLGEPFDKPVRICRYFDMKEAAQ